MNLEPALRDLLREAKVRHSLDGTCSHPTCCPMAMAILSAEAALVGLELETSEVPANWKPDSHCKRLCVCCDCELIDPAPGVNTCGKCTPQ